MNIYDAIIIGGGPSGLSASIYTSRSGLYTLCIAGNPSGGQLMWTTEVENFPGFPSGIMGPDLINNFKKQALRFNTEIKEENVTKIEGSFDTNFSVSTDSKNTYIGKVLIIATGASAKWLGLESEDKLKGKGVSACATCDGFFYRDKEVVVVGGGDTAMQEAIFLTRIVKKVHVVVIEDKDEMFASRIMQQKAFTNPKIDFYFNTKVEEILGDTKVSGVRIKNTKTNEEQILNNIEGVFIAIGHKPNTEFLKDFINLNARGFIEVSNNTQTSKEGVFASGDVSDHRYMQAITAAGLGCMAALDAEEFLEKHEKNSKE